MRFVGGAATGLRAGGGSDVLRAGGGPALGRGAEMETGVGMIGVDAISAGATGAALVNHQLAGVLSGTGVVAAARASSVHQTDPSLEVSVVPDGTEGAIKELQSAQEKTDAAWSEKMARSLARKLG